MPLIVVSRNAHRARPGSTIRQRTTERTTKLNAVIVATATETQESVAVRRDSLGQRASLAYAPVTKL